MREENGEEVEEEREVEGEAEETDQGENTLFKVPVPVIYLLKLSPTSSHKPGISHHHMRL